MRCRHCYLPLVPCLYAVRYDCPFCGHRETGFAIASRGRVRRVLDWLTGITDAV